LTQLRTRRAYEEATALCRRLAVRRLNPAQRESAPGGWFAQPVTLNPAQREYFHELTALVEAYEDSHGEHAKAATALAALARRK
jgi:hypothetical protein